MPKLTLDGKLDLHYAIPLYIRDEQIRHVNRRHLPGIAPGLVTNTPLAVVGYGPSLRDTWEDAITYPVVMSMSGSHRFLVEHGRRPDLHVEVDPRPHKVGLIGPPQDGTTYYVSSCCHPAVFEHLAGRDVKVWHVFTGKEAGFRPIPYGEWALSGGSGVGVRAIILARMLGYTNIHVFGIDGNVSPKYGSHAGEHPGQIHKTEKFSYNGVKYRTTASLLGVARETTGQLDQIPDTTVTFHGEGLVQALAKDYVRKPVPETHTIIGVQKPALLSPEYLTVQRKLHAEIPAYGTIGHQYAEIIQNIITKMQPASVLDYACGKGCLARQLDRPIWEFDPAIPGKDESPPVADLVCCIDTLEHVEEAHLPAVLDDLRRVTRKVCYLSIATTAAEKVLPDGRNMHILQRNEAWWKEKLAQFFQLGDSRVDSTAAGNGNSLTHFQIVCGPRGGAPPPGAQTIYAVRSGHAPTFGILQYDPAEKPGQAEKPKDAKPAAATPAAPVPAPQVPQPQPA